MTPEDKKLLDSHVKEIAKILYKNAPIEKLETFEGIETAVRDQVLEKDIEKDKLARFKSIKKTIQTLEKRQKQVLKQGKLAPSGAWVARYQVRQNHKKYWYYK